MRPGAHGREEEDGCVEIEHGGDERECGADLSCGYGQAGQLVSSCWQNVRPSFFA